MAVAIGQAEGPGGAQGPVAVEAQRIFAVGVPALQLAALQGPAGAPRVAQAIGIQIALPAPGVGVPEAGVRLLGPAGGLPDVGHAQGLACQAQAVLAAGDDEGRNRRPGIGLGGAGQGVLCIVAAQPHGRGVRVGELIDGVLAEGIEPRLPRDQRRRLLQSPHKAGPDAALDDLRLLYGIGVPGLQAQDGLAALTEQTRIQHTGH